MNYLLDKIKFNIQHARDEELISIRILRNKKTGKCIGRIDADSTLNDKDCKNSVKFVNDLLNKED